MLPRRRHEAHSTRPTSTPEICFLAWRDAPRSGNPPREDGTPCVLDVTHGGRTSTLSRVCEHMPALQAARARGPLVTHERTVGDRIRARGGAAAEGLRIERAVVTTMQSLSARVSRVASHALDNVVPFSRRKRCGDRKRKVPGTWDVTVFVDASLAFSATANRVSVRDGPPRP